MNDGRTLVAGVGNVFLGDDGFGVAVCRELASKAISPDVDVVDFGIRGRDLAYAVASGYARVVIVDAARRGAEPGTLTVLSPYTDGPPIPCGHGADPSQALALARALTDALPVVRLVLCEPAVIPDDDDLALGLSREVAAAVETAVTIVTGLLDQPWSPTDDA